MLRLASSWLGHLAITDVGAWRVVMLDSTVRGSDAGHLDDTQLDLLEENLRRLPV